MEVILLTGTGAGLNQLIVFFACLFVFVFFYEMLNWPAHPFQTPVHSFLFLKHVTATLCSKFTLIIP